MAIALLVAILVSVASVVNHVNSQTEMLSKLRGTGETFLLMSRNSTVLSNSKINTELIQVLNDNASVKYVLPQKIFAAAATTESNNYPVVVRGLDVSAYFKARSAYVNGSSANGLQTNVGEILARVAFISKGDKISITLGDKSVTVEVVGISQTRTQSDTELIVPMNVANQLLNQDNTTVSIIEFALKTGGKEEIQRLSNLLPGDVKIVATQQTQTLVQDINSQTVYFISLWSIPVYTVVTATAYMIATRLTLESSYELTMLKAIGAKRTKLFMLILTVTFTIASLGAILGVAVGLAGAQVISTFIQWVWRGLAVAPFLEVMQATQILLFTLTSALLGCIYPAVKATRKTYAETQL